MMLAVTFAVVVLFVMPLYQESGDLQRELIQRQAQYEARVDYYLGLTDLLGEIEDRQEALVKVNNALPDQFDMAPIVFFLQQKATQSGLLMQSVNFSEVASSNQEEDGDSSSQLKKVDFTLNINGGYQGLKGFLASLERSSRIFDVQSIIFSNSGEVGAYDFALGVTTNTY